MRALIHASRARYRSIFVAYGDCGTGGLLDAVLREEGVERIPGAHCYEFFATAPVFAALAEAELGTFYLTDFLLRHFERLVSAVWVSIGTRNCSRPTSAITASWCIWRRRRLPGAAEQARAIAARMGLAIRVSANRLRSAADVAGGRGQSGGTALERARRAIHAVEKVVAWHR